jgi:alkylhydroperoxidase family enzyme
MSKPRARAPGTTTGNSIRDSALGLATDLLDAVVALNDSVWRRNSVRPALLEMLRLRNARTVNCVFCRSVRYDVARADGLGEDRVEQIRDGFETGTLSDVEKAVLAFADTYLRHPGRFDPALVATLRAHFSEEQLCHMAIALATFNATSRCAVSLGGMPESLPVMEIALPPEDPGAGEARAPAGP